MASQPTDEPHRQAPHNRADRQAPPIRADPNLISQVEGNERAIARYRTAAQRFSDEDLTGPVTRALARSAVEHTQWDLNIPFGRKSTHRLASFLRILAVIAGGSVFIQLIPTVTLSTAVGVGLLPTIATVGIGSMLWLARDPRLKSSFMPETNGSDSSEENTRT